MPRAQSLADQRLTLLAETVITTAVTAVVTTPVILAAGLKALALQARFQYGATGTTVKVWVQTSLDKGASWTDVACFAFTTASARKVATVAMAALAPAAASDGALADDTVLNAPLGDRVRVKYTTTGTYATNTLLDVWAVTKG
jgi:hypothetical protein